jgi:hypothetical protein
MGAYNASIHLSTGVEMLEMLAIVFVTATGLIALAIALPIVFWHEQAAIIRQTSMVQRYGYRTSRPPMSRTVPLPSATPRKLVLERWIYT